jgi:predicted O-linked N-acetylglucosamine transferase (SPINDLY family)/glycosyltransferase involved in cell wall biosynthesis
MMDAENTENNSPTVKTSTPEIQTKAIKNGKPSAAEMNAIVQAFNQNAWTAAEPLAISMTQRFPGYGWGWKVLGAIYQQQSLLEAALKPLQLAAELLPQDSEAQYNLANYFYDQLQLDAAARYYKKAIKLAPKFAKSHYNLGSVYKDQGLFTDAAVHYKKALKIDPHNVAMNFNLALMLYEQADFAGAIDYYQRGLRLQPDAAQANLNLGASFKALGDLEKAKYYYQQALSINPDYIDAYNNLGLVFKELGDAVEAERCYRTAIAIEPNYAAAYNNLGLLFKEQDNVIEAESCYLKALEIDPLRAVSYNNLATIYRDQGRLAESEHCCRSAIKIKPDYGIAYSNLGLALDSMGRHAEAEAEFEQALHYEPDNIIVLSNYAVTLNTLSQLSKAALLLKKALDIFPEFINAHVNLCVNYLAQGRISEAQSVCLKALQIEPENIAVWNSLLFAMNYAATSTVEACLEQARQFGQIVALKATKPFTSWQFDASPKRLRVGLVSGDLRLHSVAYFLENLLQHIDPAVIELYAYSAANSEDYMTARLKPYFSGWKSLAGLTDQVAAQLIHDDGLHLLLDLSGHSSGNRLPVFAWKPAPVQVSWLGYFATTGLAAMDYFIADAVGVPAANQSQFVEKVKYLPDTRLCFTAPEADIAVSVLPALTNGYVTFGCFQNMAKVGDDVLDLWAEVMAKIPSARLRWQCRSFRDGQVAAELRQKLIQRGIDADRITLLGATLRDAYLAAHAEVDLMLDTFPFTGGTTTCEALWMGVPTLTLAGNSLISRQGASLMSAAGLADWVAATQEEYVNKALLLTHDLERLANLRAGLRAQVLASPLFDASRFAKNMQGLLWEMWHESQGTQPMPVIIAVADTAVAAQAEADLKEKQKIKIITATKLAEADFWSKAALGLSLKRHLKMDARLSVEVAFANARGLSEIFNQAIVRADDDDILVFMHDDVWIDEANFSDAVIAGIEHYDVIGVAGNRRRVDNQPAWAFVDVAFTWDDRSNLSGGIAHGQNAFSKPENFGEVPAACELLDGVFMASRKNSLKQVQFDPQFDFHFYDMDFCRSARKAGLKLGTWQIKLTHQSGGAFGSPQWRAKYQLYKNKWEQGAAASQLITADKAFTERELNLQQAMHEVLQMALQHQTAGRLEQAENLYLEILNIVPNHAEANHNLGVIEAQLKSALLALPRLELAVQEQPEKEQYWVSYIDALMQSGAKDAVADAIELGCKYGLSSETAQMLAAEFVLAHEIASTQVSGNDMPFAMHIHQIYYSEQTQCDNDPGFIGLDNLANERPDWREYWPIRNYLLNTSLNENDYYGFFSPKFNAKTKLDAASVYEFVSTHASAADVFLFSPFFDQGAFFLNIFEQGAMAHPSIMNAFEGSVAMIAPSVNLATLVMDSRNIVFCNYIVAKPVFWKAWLESCELIFAEAEANKTALGKSLNAADNYDGGDAPNKVFVIERVASMLLTTQSNWKVQAYNSTLLPYSNAHVAKYSQELLHMDALKIASSNQDNVENLAMFLQIKQQVNTSMSLEDATQLEQKMHEVLKVALAHQQAGHIKQAESLYLAMLNSQPKHAEANHNLGIIEAQLNGALAALPRLELAVQEQPEKEQFWVSYIDALMQTGATDTAVNAIEIGQKFGLRKQTAQMLAAEFVKQMERDQLSVQPASGVSEMLITLIPAYKTQYIAELLLSLTTQTYKNFKVIISDDSPNAEVTALISQPQFAPLLKKLNLEVIAGPKQGSFANVVNLLNRWNQSTPYVHILFDDDLIYPTFYQQHLMAHTQANIGTSVSYRWVGNEHAVPVSSPALPAFLGEGDAAVVLVETDQLFQSVVPDCSNWLGEFSNTVYSADVILKIKAQSLNGIPYHGLGDIGLLLQASLSSKTAIIKEHLGVFRMNPHQNTGNFSSISFRCAYVAWIALALSSYELGKIDVTQAKHAIDKIGNAIHNNFQGVEEMLDFVRLQQRYTVGSESYKLSFCKLWDAMLQQDSGWVAANDQSSKQTLASLSPKVLA